MKALLASLIRPGGAQCNTQSPHILKCSGVLAASRSYWPAPMLSALSSDYRDEICSITETLNRLAPGSVQAQRFGTIGEAATILESVAAEF